MTKEKLVTTVTIESIFPDKKTQLELQSALNTLDNEKNLSGQCERVLNLFIEQLQTKLGQNKNSITEFTPDDLVNPFRELVLKRTTIQPFRRKRMAEKYSDYTGILIASSAPFECLTTKVSNEDVRKKCSRYASNYALGKLAPLFREQDIKRTPRTPKEQETRQKKNEGKYKRIWEETKRDPLSMQADKDFAYKVYKQSMNPEDIKIKDGTIYFNNTMYIVPIELIPEIKRVLKLETPVIETEIKG